MPLGAALNRLVGSLDGGRRAAPPAGAIGGVFGLAMILMRRDFRKNAAMVAAIGKDVQLFMTGNRMEATGRAEDRRKQWVKLPYGIPLCVGFLGFLWYRLWLVG